MRLYLARHAQTQSNIDSALDTAHPGAPLTDLGLAQAEGLAARLATEPFTVVAASALRRAQQTAAPLAGARGLDVLTLDGLREIDAGDLEMRSSAEAIQSYVAVARAWVEGDLDAAAPGGVSGHEFLRRFDDATAALEDAADSAVAISHGTAIRTWAAIRCRNADTAAIAGRRLANTEVLVLEGSSRSGWLLESRMEADTDGTIRSVLTWLCLRRSRAIDRSEFTRVFMSVFTPSSGRQPMPEAPTVSLAERAILALREMVHDGVLLPGQPIRQATIAEQLGISRVPVREALKNLQSEGLVEASPSGGFVVARLSADELSQIYLMRRLLETELLRRIGPVPADEIAAIAEINARMESTVDHPPSREWKQLNRELHFRMFRLSGLSHVVAEVARLWDKTEPYRSVYSSQHSVRVHIVAEHDKLIDALRRGATEELITHMDSHRGASERNVVSVLSYPHQ